MTEDFREVVEELLGENGAIETLSVKSNSANIVAHSRAGENVKHDIIVGPVLEGYDVTYSGTSNGWERYTVHNDDVDFSAEEHELREVVLDYKREAGAARRHELSFGEWYRENVVE